MTEATEKKEVAASPEVKEDAVTLDPAIAAEIDAGVESVVKEKADEAAAAAAEAAKDDDTIIKPGAEDKTDEEKAEEEAAAEAAAKKEDGSEDDLPDGDEELSDEEKEAAKKKADEDSSITDEQLERAIKVNMSIADARTFPNAKALDSALTILEAHTKKEGDSDDDAGGDVETIDDLLAKIPDLDPGTYDEGIVSAVNALKDLVGSQAKTIEGLKNDGAAKAGNWFSDRVADLSESYTEALKAEPAKREALKGKFDVLSAGYKASGSEVGQSEVFKEALSIVMGDVAAKDAEAVTQAKLASRKKQHVAKPSSSKVLPKADAEEQTAKDIDEKFSSK